MVYFQTKNPNLGKFWSAVDWKTLKYLMAIWIIFLTLVIFYDHLVHFLPFLGGVRCRAFIFLQLAQQQCKLGTS
jgi:hypothetical protein